VQTSVLGHFAADEAGRRLEKILLENGVRIIELPSTSEAPTIIKTRVIVRNQQLCRIDREYARDLYRVDEAPGFEEKLTAVLDEVDAVIISDYAKGVITQPLIDMVIGRSLGSGRLLVSVDPKPSRKLNFRGAGLLTPNRSEALELAGMPHIRQDEPYPLEEICRRIAELYDPGLLIITLGADGMVLYQQGKIVKHLLTEAREVYDVSGAGDTVIATLTAALASGLDPAEAAWLANGAAGCVVAHIGTVPVKMNELQKWLENK